MKMLWLFFMFSAGYAAPLAEPDIRVLRSLLYASAESKDSWIQLAKTVEPISQQSKPILLCYRGVSEMMGAKYVLNPMTKLKRFKSGKTLIEKAVKNDPDEMEIRFLRFTVQTNLPAFLGYNSNISSDKKLLLDNVHKLTDPQLRKNILGYLSSSSYCTAEEKKALMK